MIAALVFSMASALASEETFPVAQGRSMCEQDRGNCSWPGQTPNPTEAESKTPQAPAATPRPGRPAAKPGVPSGPGNLPPYLTEARRTAPETEDGVVVVAERLTGALLPGLRAGDILHAELEQSIKASPSVPTPVRARVTRGPFRGAFVLGVAAFDLELKRILLTFERLRIRGNDMTFALRGTGLAPSGQVGLEGDYQTREGTYFAGEILAATAAGFADATTQRTQTAFGTYQTEPTIANAGKQGAVQALSKTAERYADRARTAPEFTEIEAGREIQILIQESPVEASAP